ncbi:hypothetical protein LOZ61_005617 [Ophidiomyces ophidiicola]|nr:hypothetical protein LOZ61_005617 [Ophidiomyces ophidiicola]KAI1931056.1 hypothetical protein LOZ60_000490 [Ophidiomyces ophidiicola]KAI1964214.1 hypothetical protein LOZ56_006280 [Ophidiomyces ophidiicola]KAI2055930.1 hypothetical protein LOZ43_003579 [Ophidiomyces ophidiicola]KAI2091498.1 hypothetical protein LOZ36_000887 [Ophidiomyces ophidiicola]
MDVQHVAFVGADGKLGPSVLKALASSGQFNITVLKRRSSSSVSNYPPSVQTVLIPDEFPVDDLIEALKGKDAVVVTVNGSLDKLQMRLADAAAQAGVKQFIPADFGSCDSQEQMICELVPIFQRKANVRNHLNSLVVRYPGFLWTSLVCGHFFDQEDLEFLHIDLKRQKADVLDDGETRASTSTFHQIGSAVVKILERRGMEEIKNRVIYIQSFFVSQMQVVRAFEHAMGQKWEISHINSATLIKEKKEEADKKGTVASVDLVWALGTLYANWEKKDGFANEVLGLVEEDISKVVANFVDLNDNHS